MSRDASASWGELSAHQGFNSMCSDWFTIIADEHMCTEVSVCVLRTRRERWLSIPWRPWRKTKTVTRCIPRDDVMVFGHTMVCHPSIEARLRSDYAYQRSQMTQEEQR